METIKQTSSETFDFVLAGAAIGMICDVFYLVFLDSYWPLRFLGLEITYDQFVHHYYIILPGVGVELLPEVAALAGLIFPFSFACLAWLNVRRKIIKPSLHPRLQISLIIGGSVAFLICIYCFLSLFAM